MCFSTEEIENAIKHAINESTDGKFIIEEYMGQRNDLQLVYFVLDGKPFLLRIEDRFLGDKNDGLDKLCIATRSPSVNLDSYLLHADSAIRKMIVELGIKNAPVFIQAFMDEETAKVYDPGLRFPGNDFDRLYYNESGLNFPELLVEFALTGEMSSMIDSDEISSAVNCKGAMLFPCIRAGQISQILGMKELNDISNVINIQYLYQPGDTIICSGDVRQRLCEIDIRFRDTEDLINTIKQIQSILSVRDANNEEMIISAFDFSLLR